MIRPAFDMVFRSAYLLFGPQKVNIQPKDQTFEKTHFYFFITVPKFRILTRRRPPARMHKAWVHQKSWFLKKFPPKLDHIFKFIDFLEMYFKIIDFQKLFQNFVKKCISKCTFRLIFNIFGVSGWSGSMRLDLTILKL